MKKVIVVLVFVSLSIFSKAQVFVEGVDINAADVEYIEILGFQKHLDTDLTAVAIDYGQDVKYFKSQKMKDKNGAEVKLKGLVEALNFLSKNGWVYISNYTVSFPSGANVYHYLLRKKQ